MDLREYTRAREYHAGLMRQAQAERLAATARPVPTGYMSLPDRVLLFTANVLIAAGEKLRRRVVIYRLNEDCL